MRDLLEVSFWLLNFISIYAFHVTISKRNCGSSFGVKLCKAYPVLDSSYPSASLNWSLVDLESCAFEAWSGCYDLMAGDCFTLFKLYIYNFAIEQIYL